MIRIDNKHRVVHSLAFLLFFMLGFVEDSSSQSKPDSLKYILMSNPKSKVLANIGDGLSTPNDLAFHPDLAKNELWIVNQRNENSGGSTLTLSETNTPNQSGWLRVDGNAWHFMSLPTGIAFSSDNGNFATSTGVFSANHNGTDFTGPTLWSSDPDIYARPSGGNGSHLDMLHGSPFCMGIAHEVDNVFWVTDTYWGHLVRYDFVDDHGPGNDYHADAKVWRYEQESVSRISGIPSHLVIEKTDGILYAVDAGRNRILVMDINSGEFNRTLPFKNERLAQHWSMKNADISIVLEDRFLQPCGIEVFKEYLLIGDYRSGEIVVFDRNNNYEELGVIQTEEGSGLSGIVIGPDGNIYYTNRTKNIVGVISADLSTVAISDVNFEPKFTITPNPSSGGQVSLNLEQDGDLEVFNAMGHSVDNYRGLKSSDLLINTADFIPGVYHFVLRTKHGSIARKFVRN